MLFRSIELGEIEAVLSLYDKVAAVSVCFDKEKSELVTFFQKKESGSPILEKDLRRFCEQSLPKYMTPKVFIEVSEMPLNANGKIDKKELWRRYQESIIDPKHRT